jgi:L-threonylcarbamoyladenylate synthase
MHLSPTNGRHVAAAFDGHTGLLLDAGPVAVGIESTVVDLSSDVPTILRPGMISRAELSALIGEVQSISEARGSEARPSPGMLDRHYSPAATLIVGAGGDRREELAGMVGDAIVAGRRVAVLALSDLDVPAARVIRMPDAPDAYARLLYSTLHALDADGIDVVYVEGVPDTGAWDGIRDRLRRAAT